MEGEGEVKVILFGPSSLSACKESLRYFTVSEVSEWCRTCEHLELEMSDMKFKWKVFLRKSNTTQKALWNDGRIFDYVCSLEIPNPM